MKIAFDAQPILDHEKTGIGWNTKAIIDEIIREGENQVQLNVFDFRNHKYNDEILHQYKRKGCIVKRCRWMPAGGYQLLTRCFPLSYKMIFGKNADITQFFNYTIAPGVGTVTGTFIYDMTCRAFPETIQKKTASWLKHLPDYCKRSSFIFTISEFSKSEIIKYLNVDSSKIFVIPCAIEHSVYRPDYSKAEIEKTKEQYGIDGNYILYLGTLEPRKNIPLLIKSYYILKNRCMHDMPQLVLAGKKGWMYDEIFALIAKYKLEKNVIFTGYIDQSASPRLMAGAEMFVFPSLYEGFGMPPVEAMACGTPVIVSDAASLPEVVGDAGIITPVMDEDKLALNMQNLLESNTLRETYVKRGIERAARYTVTYATKKMLNVYKNFCSRS